MATAEDTLDRPAPSTDVSATGSPLYRRYVLWLLLLVYVVNFLDRQVINILAEPIKNDLHLLDWQVGLLSGAAFGLVYSVLGFPLARAADRYNRSWIIAGCLAAWSAFTGVCDLAQNFLQLVLARAGVGIGEAGCTPTSHALIADYTPKEKRASALAFFSMGTPIGAVLGTIVGGVLQDAFNWRVAFLVAATPGLVLALVCLVTLKEPRRRVAAAAQRVAAASSSFAETFAYLQRKKAFWFLAFAAGIRAFLGYGHAPFTASFLLRVHGHELTAIAAGFGMKPYTFLGLVLGTMGGLAGVFSSWLGGFIADRWGAKDLRVYGSVPAISVLLSTPFSLIIYTTGSTWAALLLGLVPAIMGGIWYGPVYSSAQGMVPQHMRATSASIMLFVINFLGLVLGAVCVGLISDVFNKGLGMGPAEGVRWALVWTSVGGLVSVLLFWMARRNIRDEMES